MEIRTMNKQILRKLLRPPFVNINNSFGCQENDDLLRLGDNKLLLNDTFYLRFKKFIVTALNWEWERILSKPLRWEIDDEYGYRGVRCPKCGSEYECFFDNIKEDYRYCSRCGTRLLPPKEKEKNA